MIQDVQVKVAKEVDDVGALLVTIVADIRAKKPISEIAADALPKLIAAIDGVEQIPAELVASRKVVLSTIGARLGELTDAILGQPTAPVTPPIA